MSDCLVNVRIGLFHFQLSKSWRLRFSRNDFHRGYPDGRVAIYELFGLERLWR
ncbi:MULTISPECIES: hypothetical protein [unclassified Aureimonas]|uniref:hypothetical protein n=1 Tax=unclassified Aureimonas TaxID=2615206 RepID=UPI000A8863AE|nr:MULTISPECIES: hypothetical protein [unclassified Aureimonas]